VIGSAILPLERDGVQLMSIGWVNPNSMLLRGAKIAPLVEQMVGQTAWGPLDFLVVDLPRPRWEYDVRGEERFAELRHTIWEMIRSDVVADANVAAVS
jgi:Mrp family chromosome partitioning ATPase